MKYWRSVFTIEVLTSGDAPPVYEDLNAMADDIVFGSASGSRLEEKHEEVSKERMAELLTSQGSDPEFLIEPEEEVK